MSIECSIIIPTHNRAEILEKCLQALDNQNLAAEKYEIIIINDGSTDNTDELIKNINIKPTLKYESQKQSGPGAGRNRGLKMARGTFIIFIDDDIIVCPEFVSAHLLKHKNNENDKILVHGPVIYTNNLDNPTAEEKKITDYYRSFFSTGNVSIRKKYLFEAGLFNEIFTEYGWEDLEMGNRLKKLGLEAVRITEAKGYHLKYIFSPEKLPALIEKEKQRGRMAVLYHKVDSSYSVKMSTLYWPPFFLIIKVLTIGNWPNKNACYKLINYLHKKNHKNLRNFILWFVKLKAYYNGMKQGSDQ